MGACRREPRFRATDPSPRSWRAQWRSLDKLELCWQYLLCRPHDSNGPWIRGAMGVLGNRFIDAFNGIETYLKSVMQAKQGARFVELTRAYAKAHKLPSEQLDALLTFASLRNAIAHGRYYDGQPIAEPVPEVVDEIEKLRKQLTSPPRVLEVLEPQDVCLVHPKQHIGKALEYVRQFDYSQIPVYDESGYAGILTTNSIARWLAENLDGQGPLTNALIEDVLAFSEVTDRAVFADRAVTAAEAVDILARSNLNELPASALIISESGQKTDEPVRVVVMFDLPILSASLRFR